MAVRWPSVRSFFEAVATGALGFLSGLRDRYIFGQRARAQLTERYPNAPPEVISQVESATTRSREAARVIARLPAEGVVPPEQIPVVPTLGPAYQYVAVVGYNDPDTGEAKELRVKVENSTPLSKAEVEARAYASAAHILSSSMGQPIPEETAVNTTTYVYVERITRNQ